MTNDDACKWLNNLRNDMGNPHYECLWVYAQAIDEIILMLEEQPQIVQCKDCRKGTVLDEYYVKCNLYKAIHAPMFHCADGEKRTD